MDHTDHTDRVHALARGGPAGSFSICFYAPIVSGWICCLGVHVGCTNLTSSEDDNNRENYYSFLCEYGDQN